MFFVYFRQIVMTFKAMHYLKLYLPNIKKKTKKTPYCRQLCLLFDAHIPQSILGKITVRSKITTLTCNSIKMSRYSGFLCIPCCFSQWNPLMLELSLICLSPHHPFFFFLSGCKARTGIKMRPPGPLLILLYVTLSKCLKVVSKRGSGI